LSFATVVPGCGGGWVALTVGRRAKRKIARVSVATLRISEWLITGEYIWSYMIQGDSNRF
jgi:hypothetical protein